MSDEIRKIAVVGTGPSGLYAALLLARKGYTVRLFDPKTPWEHPRGGGISEEGLRRFSLLDGLSGSVSLSGLKFLSPKGREHFILFETPVRIVFRRQVEEFLRRLLDKEGIGIHHEKIDRITQVSHHWRIGVDGDVWEADFLIGADGATSLIRKTLAFKEPALSDEATFEASYEVPQDLGGVGVVKFLEEGSGVFFALPSEGGTLVRLWVSSRLRDTRVLFNKQDLIARSVLPVPPPEDIKRYMAQIPRFQKFIPSEMAGDRWAVIGEAGGLVDPVSQDGLGLSLQSAVLLAASFDASGEVRRHYLLRLEEEVIGPLRKASRLGWRLRRKFLVEWMVGRAGRSEKHQRTLLGLLAASAGLKKESPRS